MRDGFDRVVHNVWRVDAFPPIHLVQLNTWWHGHDNQVLQRPPGCCLISTRSVLATGRF